ncbi:MAG: hypothetical protein ACOX20_05370 [Limnochordia bacterium]
MNSRLRIKTALSGGKPDRVPLVNVFSLPYLQSRLGMRDSIIKAFMENPGSSSTSRSRWVMIP